MKRAILALLAFALTASGSIQQQHTAVIQKKRTGGGSPPANTLDDFTGLDAWYKTPIVGATDGNPITSWPDSKNSHHLTSTGTAPTYRSAVINGLDAVDFGSTYLNTGGSSSSSYPMTFVAVVNFTTTGNYQYILGSTAGGADLRTDSGSDHLNSDKSQVANIGTGSVAVTNGWHVVMAVLTSSTWAFWIDGVTAGSGSHSVTLEASQHFLLGCDSGGTNIFAGRMGEVGIYTADRSGDATAIKETLFTKYGL